MKTGLLFAGMVLCCAMTVAVRAQAPGNFLDALEAERAEQSGTAITIIFDDSGSMQGAKLAQAKTAFREWIAKVPANHRLGLMALNAGAIVPLGRDNRPALLAAVDQLQANGGTPLAASIRQALANLERRRGEIGPYERHILLVFTDGQDTTQDGVAGVQRSLEEARRRNVETVGIGYHREGDYMRNFATRYYDANNVAELKNSLAKVDAEIGDTSDLVLDEGTIKIMKTVSALPASEAPKQAAASEPGTAPAAARRKSPNLLPWLIFFGVIAYVLIQKVRRAAGR